MDLELGRWAWLALRMFYLYGLVTYVSSAPPMVKVTVGGESPCSSLESGGWFCQSCVVPAIDSANAVKEADGDAPYVLSNPFDLRRGVDVVFATAVVHVQCMWHGMSPPLYMSMVAAATIDVSHAVFYDALPHAAHALTWVALAAIAYKAFHFAFVF